MLDEAMPFWLTLIEPPEGCYPVLEALIVSKRVLADDVWARILRYHIVPGKKLTAAGITSKQVEQTDEGSTVVLTKKANTILVGDAKIIQTDIQAANGVIHVIDQVLVPPLD